ncbi:MAG: sugar phosphate isomerase/epimerase family protein [Verrucomicrobiota bacterium]|nr:sugar phosphate isomerase/epimerase family protein [Verrucomicrobiota bacterium]
MKRKLSLNYWTLGGFDGQVPLRTALNQAHAMGWQALELAFGAGELARTPSESECTALRHYADKLGMPFITMASGAYWTQSLSHPDASVRALAVEFTKEYLKTAAMLGVKTILVVPGHVAVPWDAGQPVVPYDKAWQWSQESLRHCIGLAEKLDVTIGLENVWNWFLADPVAMRSFIDELGSTHVGAYFDIGNCLINGYPEHWISLLASRIKAVHVKNFQRSDCGGKIQGFGESLLTGDAQWPAILGALDEINYTGPLTVEMIPFCRLPNLNLPDKPLAATMLSELNTIVGSV